LGVAGEVLRVNGMGARYFRRHFHTEMCFPADAVPRLDERFYLGRVETFALSTAGGHFWSAQEG
jgi:hypothetical protein